MASGQDRKIAQIVQAIALGSYRYTIHAAQQRIARGIERAEIEAAIANGLIVEDYPAHRFGPCCLIFGRTPDGKALHVL